MTPSTSSAALRAMDWADKRRATLEARAVRDELGVATDIAFDPFAAAERLGVQIVYLNIGDRDPVEGAFLRRRGRSFILINSAKGTRRARFTCAHELGHFRLLDPNEDVEFVDTEQTINRPKDYEERMACVFAAELLAPAEGIQAVIESTEHVEDWVGTLVRQYGISPKAAAIRLAECDFISQDVLHDIETTIDQDYRGFWRRQRVPPETSAHDGTALPARYVTLANELHEAGVISDERKDELLNRPLVPAE